MLQHFSRGTPDHGHSPQPMTRALDRRDRMMLIAAPPDGLPRFSFENSPLQRLCVVIVQQGRVPDVPPSSVIAELPQLETNAVTSPHSRPLRHSRRLQGEILCDGAGRLYEKVGHLVHPIHQLVVGPRGEVLDLAPPRPAPPRSREAVIDIEEPPVIAAPTRSPAGAQVGESRQETKDEARPQPARWRELPSNCSRIVQFGEFKSALSQQILDPTRLRDAHRLSCRVHIYESARTQRIETLAAEIPNGATGQLLPLTPALVARLDLADFVTRPRHAAVGTREPGLIFPGERVVRLEVLHDPTAIVTSPGDAGRTSDSEPAARCAAPTEQDNHAGPKAIPERFMVPWQFVLSRDEAIYDMNVEATRPRVLSAIDRLLAITANRGQLRKWQALLRGRSLDDQLWGVRPPRAGLSNPVIRDWARRMLEAAGYDPATMLFEWEVYWRRRQA